MRPAALLAALLAAASAAAAQTAPHIVTLAPHLAEMVCALDACTQLVGSVAYTDYPPQAAQAPKIGDAFNVNAEQLLALQPDLVLAWRGGTPPATVQKLESLGITVAWIGVEGIAGVADALLDVGGWIGAEDAACAAADRYRSRLAGLRARYARGNGQAPLRVLYQIGRAPIYTVSRASPISDAIAICGGVNVFADLPQIAAPVSVEAVLARAPQAIVFAQQEAPEQIRADWQRWPQLPAVADDRLLAIDADLLARQSPRLLDGVAALCAALNGE